MKNGDFIVWRYHDNPITQKCITHYGILQALDTFYYNIKDLETGKVERLVQPHISIVVDRKYEKINSLDKNRLYSREELVELFGEDAEPEKPKYYTFELL